MKNKNLLTIRLHYIEYLGDLVWKNCIDPIDIFNVDELELVLRRANIRLPQNLNAYDYREKLISLIKDELPLEKF